MGKYGKTTSVPVERSQAEARKILTDNHCDDIRHMETSTGYALEFVYNYRLIRFVIKYPEMDSPEICETETGKIRTPDQVEKAYSQEVRRLYRALCMCIRMKFEIVDSGISCFEDEFLSHTVDPITKQTYGKFLHPYIEDRIAGIDVSPTLCLPVPE